MNGIGLGGGGGGGGVGGRQFNPNFGGGNQPGTVVVSGAAAALRAAAATGNLQLCQQYLKNVHVGGVKFSCDELGRNALHLAASNGHCTIVRLLLNYAAPKEIDQPDGNGCAALQRASADGHEEVLRLLLARGADVDRQDAVHGNSALHESAWKGYSRSVRLLSAAGATLNRPNAGGFTALHLCCQNGHNQSCRELLLAGCNPNVQNNYGDTALHTAARYGHAGVTRILISAQCHISEQNKNGDTALHIASAMGRRKLTRILLEAGCDKSIKNKQNETARDIALRKDLNEILNILDAEFVVAVNNNNNNTSNSGNNSGNVSNVVVGGSSKKEKKSSKGGKKRAKSKVRFDQKATTETDMVSKPRHWSPYGCHYYPDPEAFPSPRLDSLPQEPLKRGEQYYLDLAGNICKGPVGVGYTCYCAPLFRHLEARLERDKRELQKAQVRLGQRVAGLEQKLNRGVHGRRSERVLGTTQREQSYQEVQLPRSRSLEMLDQVELRAPLQSTRSMDELEADDGTPSDARPSVKELVARIQQQQTKQPPPETSPPHNNSESSDDEDSPLRMQQRCGPMGASNLAIAMPNYENIPGDLPRSRSALYSPTMELQANNPTLIQSSVQQETNSSTQMAYRFQYYEADLSPKFYEPNPKYNTSADIGARFAKLRLLDGSGSPGGAGGGGGATTTTQKLYESATRMLENPQDTIDRDTNNDSGYSTKVYGSSKGNSPSLSGQIDNECLGASSLV